MWGEVGQIFHLHSQQALQLPYEIFSASDTNADYRAFVLDNHGDAVHSMYDSVETQLSAAEGKPQGKAIRLLMAGSPCDPFSVMRGKRYQPGSVDTHGLTQVTMDSVLKAYQTFNPHMGILEQVEGFLKPISETDRSTPMDRPGRAMLN